jgi:3-hydroxyacyl-CoA dehydrogenase
MIVGGEPVSADEARRYGIVDQVFEGELLPAGLGYAEMLLAQGIGPRRSGERNAHQRGAADNAALLQAKRDEIQSLMPELFSPLRCVAAIEAATVLPLLEGLQLERALFQECLQSPQRATLIDKFFADRKAAKRSVDQGDKR